MSTNAQYTKNARQTSVTINTANTALDGSGTMSIVWTAPAYVSDTNPGGSRIERLTIIGAGPVTAGMIRIFVSSDAAANTTSNTFLYQEVPVTATTPSATVQSFNASLQAVTYQTTFPIMLGAGCTLRVSTNNADTFEITAMGGDY